MILKYTENLIVKSYSSFMAIKLVITITNNTIWASQKGAVDGLSGSLNDLPEGGEVDVVLISEQQEGGGEAAAPNSGLRVGAHHICHCRYVQILQSVILSMGFLN